MDPTGSALSEEGRWHKKGERVLYCSFSFATCVLELKVNGVSFKTIREVNHYSTVDIPNDLGIDVVPETFYASGWQATKAISQEHGSIWYHELRSPILQVRSSVMPVEQNIIINTLHPDFAKIKFLDPLPTELDPRLVK